MCPLPAPLAAAAPPAFPPRCSVSKSLRGSTGSRSGSRSRTVKESIFLTHVAGHNEEQDKDKEAKEQNEWQSGEVKEATAKSEPED